MMRVVEGVLVVVVGVEGRGGHGGGGEGLGEAQRVVHVHVQVDIHVELETDVHIGERKVDVDVGLVGRRGRGRGYDGERRWGKGRHCVIELEFVGVEVQVKVGGDRYAGRWAASLVGWRWRRRAGWDDVGPPGAGSLG